MTWQSKAIDPCLVAAIAQSHKTGRDEVSRVDDDARKSSNKGFELRHQSSLVGLPLAGRMHHVQYLSIRAPRVSIARLRDMSSARPEKDSA